MSSERTFVDHRSGLPRGRPFAKGNGGRRPGSKNKSTLLAAALRPGEEVELVRKAIELAKDGDVPMLKFVLDRILPKDRHVKLDVPQINDPHEAFHVLAAVVRAVAAGEIAPSEGAAVATLVAGLARFVDITEFENRIQALESEMTRLNVKP
jgi:hypothetical protein